MRGLSSPSSGSAFLQLSAFLWAFLCGFGGAGAAADTPAAPAAWQPLRVHVQCEGWGRTKACPQFLRGFIEETPVLQWAPLARAQVVVHVTTTMRANDDLVFLRFTSELAGAPRALELTQVVSTRDPDDAQRAALRPAFERGIAAFLAVTLPEAVQVTLVTPVDSVRAPPPTSPWDVSMHLGGHWNWSEDFKSLNSWGGVGVARTTATQRFSLGVGGSYGLTQQPPLVFDGMEISLDTTYFDVTSRVLVAHVLDAHWSLGGVARAGTQDEDHRYQATGRVHAGVSWDLFASSDPRGNQLSLTYLLGGQLDRYHTENDRGERSALFGSQGAVAAGAVRKDTVSYRLELSAFAQLGSPLAAPRRYVVDLSPEVELQLGTHVDVSLRLSLTKQDAPAQIIDETDFGAVTSQEYAQPLSVSTFFSLRIHFDRTNPDRNNRFAASYHLGELDTL